MTREGAGTGTVLGQQHAHSPALPSGDLAGKASAENFPVALRMLPRRHREHLMAVYAFARTVDDVGDEAPPDQRQQLLADLAEDLERLYANLPGGQMGAPGSTGSPAAEPRDPAVRGLAKVAADCAVPIQPFRDLIAANQQDQVVLRYQTFEDLLGYCQLSANPVGRIVLYVFGCSTPSRAELSDFVCSGLQVVEHLQDVAEDFRAGRIYLPLDDLRSHGCTEADLSAPSASPQLRSLIAAEAARAAALITAGAPLVGQLRGAARAAVAGYVAGGRAALAALAKAQYDVLSVTPRPSKGRTALGLVSVLVRGR
ncbi:MAG: squalene synthase HpnC [Actinobacteria bacterium]|nr:squalene synthase HpnC [Actinomycetota bacterium]